jgi:hypothetical protein
MKLIRGGEVKIYSSAKEMPIGRYADFQKYLVQNIDVRDLTSILSKATAFSQEGMNKECEIEIENANKAILSLQTGIPITSYCFAVLVAEIGLKQPLICNDTTIDGLNQTISELNKLGITQQEIEDAIEDVKKK